MTKRKNTAPDFRTLPARFLTEAEEELLAKAIKRKGALNLSVPNGMRLCYLLQGNFTICALMLCSRLVGLGAAKRNPTDGHDSARACNIALARAAKQAVQGMELTK